MVFTWVISHLGYLCPILQVHSSVNTYKGFVGIKMSNLEHSTERLQAKLIHFSFQSCLSLSLWSNTPWFVIPQLQAPAYSSSARNGICLIEGSLVQSHHDHRDQMTQTASSKFPQASFIFPSSLVALELLICPQDWALDNHVSSTMLACSFFVHHWAENRQWSKIFFYDLYRELGQIFVNELPINFICW